MVPIGPQHISFGGTINYNHPVWTLVVISKGKFYMKFSGYHMDLWGICVIILNLIIGVKAYLTLLKRLRDKNGNQQHVQVIDG